MCDFLALKEGLLAICKVFDVPSSLLCFGKNANKREGSRAARRALQCD